MTLSNQIHHALRHGVAKNGKIVMERMKWTTIADSIGVKSPIVFGELCHMVNDGLISRETSRIGIVYWRKGKGCV